MDRTNVPHPESGPFRLANLAHSGKVGDVFLSDAESIEKKNTVTHYLPICMICAIC